MTVHKAKTTATDKWYQETQVEFDKDKCMPVDRGRVTGMAMATDYTGDIEGKSANYYAMLTIGDFDCDDKMAMPNDLRFTGVSIFQGTVLGKKGSFAVQTIGAVRGGFNDASLTILHGTGTGELVGISGSAQFHIAAADCSKPTDVTWDIEFA